MGKILPTKVPRGQVSVALLIVFFWYHLAFCPPIKYLIGTSKVPNVLVP
jgi:hypothetical protein